MKRTVALIVLLMALLLGSVLTPATQSARAASPASPAAAQTYSQSAALFEKTRFLTYMGLGFYAFYHFVYKRYLNGEFTSGSLKRLAGVYAEAAIALLFAYNRFNAAYSIANKSNSKTLKALAAPLNKLKSYFDTQQKNLKAGKFSASGMDQLNAETQKFYSLSRFNGYTITQIPTMIPGAGK